MAQLGENLRNRPPPTTVIHLALEGEAGSYACRIAVRVTPRCQRLIEGSLRDAIERPSRDGIPSLLGHHRPRSVRIKLSRVRQSAHDLRVHLGGHLHRLAWDLSRNGR